VNRIDKAIQEVNQAVDHIIDAMPRAGCLKDTEISQDRSARGSCTDAVSARDVVDEKHENPWKGR
jgi:hypothetical protein